VGPGRARIDNRSILLRLPMIWPVSSPEWGTHSDLVLEPGERFASGVEVGSHSTPEPEHE